MKIFKTLFLVLLVLVSFSRLSVAQTNITKIEYYIDNDPGYGLGIDVAITPNINFTNLSVPINLNSITTGLHTLYFRAKNANNNWSLQNSILFYKPSISTNQPLSNIIALEYFIDNDPGYGMANQIPMAPNTNISNLVLPIHPSNLNSGIHSIYIRAKDANNRWSLVNSVICYKPYSATNSSSLSNITKLEYFIDTDPGYGLANNINITPSTNISNLILPIQPSNLTVGLHSIYCRARDMNGKWSLVNTAIVYKPYAVSPTSISNITRLEYYIDKDPGYGLATQISITPSIDIANIILPLNVSILSVGMHTIHLRSQDANGNWSLKNAALFYKPYTPPSLSSLANIDQLEYYFDYDPGLGNAKTIMFSPSSDLSNLVIPIDPFPLSVCEHNLYVRARNLNGQWSLVNATPVIVPMTISVKMFIEGYYYGNHLMTETLNNQGVQSGPCLEVDSVLVELRDTMSPYTVAYSYKGVLRTDGILPCKFPTAANGNSYYIVLNHRNALQTWSAHPVLLTIGLSGFTNYDFTTAANQAFGSNQIEVDSNTYALYSGDLNQDENIDLLDLGGVENDINEFQFGYFATDINGDGNVDLLDLAPVEANISNFIFSIHP